MLLKGQFSRSTHINKWWMLWAGMRCLRFWLDFDSDSDFNTYCAILHTVYNITISYCEIIQISIHWGPVFEWGKKKNRNALSPKAKGVRRGAVGAEDRAPKARRVSMQLGDLGERCELRQRVWAEPGRQTTFGAFLVWKCFIWQGPS